MGLAAGRLRHRVTIERPRDDSDARDANGDLVTDWPTIDKVWAAIEPLSARETFAAQQVQSAVTHKVTIRFRGDLSSKYRFSYLDPATNRTRRFYIDGTPTSPEEKREFLECVCQERSA